MKLIIKLFITFFCCFIQAQQTEYVDFKSVKAQLSLFPEKQAVGGFLNYEFKILKSVDSIFIDAVNMEFQTVCIDGKKISYSNDSKKLWLKHDFKSDSIYELTFNYIAVPKKALYFMDWDFEDGNKQIWTQGQGKYTSNWLPSIDDMNDKIEFDLSIEFDKNYEVISNGKLTNQQINESTTTWHYDMQKPMSSYLVALAIGKYDKKVETSKSGIPLEMYYYPEDSLKFEPTYRYTKQMFDFLEEEIGVPYPWQNYKQVPVKDFLYAGMENTSITIFSDTYLIDSISFVDKNYVNVNAHELAHQWFGNLVTETSGTHHWLQEGFATYYALLAERDVFGDDYYYWQLYEYAQELLEQDKMGGSTSLLNPNASSTTFYKKGAWVLHILREKVGDKAFKKSIKNYLKKYQFKNVETDDFITEVEKTSGKDLNEFVQKWLVSSELNYLEMEKRFFANKVFIQDIHGEMNPLGMTQYYPLNCEDYPEACKIILLQSDDSFLNEKIVEKLNGHISKTTFLKDDIKVRQAIAKSLSKIPSALKSDYEALLDDASYITIETALYNLWNNFPEDRPAYLTKTKHLQGFNDKNIRTLWLTLALITEGFEPEKKSEYFEELTNYTNPSLHFEIRQNAFQYLKLINACNEICKENLEQATKHPVWQFSKMAKDLLKN